MLNSSRLFTFLLVLNTDLNVHKTPPIELLMFSSFHLFSSPSVPSQVNDLIVGGFDSFEEYVFLLSTWPTSSGALALFI